MDTTQKISMWSAVAVIVAAVITGTAMLLADSDKGSVRNDCSTTSYCAGRDVNKSE